MTKGETKREKERNRQEMREIIDVSCFGMIDYKIIYFLEHFRVYLVVGTE